MAIRVEARRDGKPPASRAGTKESRKPVQPRPRWTRGCGVDRLGIETGDLHAFADSVPFPCSPPTNAAGFLPFLDLDDKDMPPKPAASAAERDLGKVAFARSRRAREDRPSGVSRKAALAVRAPPATRAVSSSRAQKSRPARAAFSSCAASPGRSTTRPASKLMPPLTSSNSGRPNGSTASQPPGRAQARVAVRRSRRDDLRRIHVGRLDAAVDSERRSEPEATRPRTPRPSSGP